MVYCFTHSFRKVFSSPSRLAKVALGWRCHGPHGFEMAFLLWQQHWHLPRRCTFFRSRWWFWWGFLWMEKDGHWWKIYWSSTKIQTIYCSYCRLFNQKYQKFTRSSVAGGLPRLHLDSHALETGMTKTCWIRIRRAPTVVPTYFQLSYPISSMYGIYANIKGVYWW